MGWCEFKRKTWRDGPARFGTLCTAMERASAVRLDGLSAGLAARGSEGDLRQALGAGLVGDGLGSLDSREELLHREHEEEVDDTGKDEEVDASGDEAAVFNGGSVDVEDEGREIGFAYDRADERADYVADEGFGYVGKGCANDDCNGKIHDIAAKDEIAKAFKHVRSP